MEQNSTASGFTTVTGILSAITYFTYVGGLVLNGVVILMFLQRKNLRTVNNMLVLNLAVGDTMQILVKLIVQIYYEILKKISLDHYRGIVRFVPFLFVSLNGWSVVAMSIRYYKLSTYPVFTDYSAKLKISKKKEVICYIATLWVVCFIISLPEFISFIYGEDPEEFKFVSIWNLMFNGILPLAIIFVLYAVTFFNVTGSVSIESGVPTYWSRGRSARVLMSLTFVFVACNIPISVWDVVYTWSDFTHSTNYRLIYLYAYFIYYFSFSVNPIALYCASNVFRHHFSKTVTSIIDKIPRCRKIQEYHMDQPDLEQCGQIHSK